MEFQFLTFINIAYLFFLCYNSYILKKKGLYLMNGICKITDLDSLKPETLVLLDDELRWN